MMMATPRRQMTEPARSYLEGRDTRADPDQAAVFPDALPHEPGAADLSERGDDE
jgi:hypothetical protein